MASIGSKKGTEKATSGITRRSIKNGEVIGPKLHKDVLSGAYYFYAGKGQPLLFLADLSGVAAGADDVDCVAVLPNGLHVFYTPIGTVSAAPYGPQASASGLDLGIDLTNNEGLNLVFGGALASGVPVSNPFSITCKRLATDPIPAGMFLRVKLLIEDVSGVDIVAFGFRKAEDFQAVYASYDELAAFNVISGDIKIDTTLNATPATAVDTTENWADGETHELLVVANGNGKIQFFLDGAEPAVTKAFQFDANEVIVPFAHVLQDTDLSHVYITELEVGNLEQLYSLTTHERVLLP